jgi:hypothetical protein
MDKPSIFVSVGRAANEQQEPFIRAVEERLRVEGLIPCTVGRNTFSADAPLKAVKELMDKCSGTVVIALERTCFPAGTEMRGGPKETSITDIKLPTPWNQIEAAMAHSRGHPLLVIVENGLKSEGLLERSHEWYVQWVALEGSALNSNEFSGVLSSWKEKVKEKPKQRPTTAASQATVAELLGSLKPGQLWSILGALGAALAAAFGLGAKLFPG